MNPTVQDLVDRLLSDGVQMWHGPERTFHGDPLSQEAAACITSLSQLNEQMEAALKKIAERRHPSGDPLQFADISELRDYAVDALRIVATQRAALSPPSPTEERK